MSDPELTPAEEQVRRLLADARHIEPMPDDVAARLDRVLGDLHDEPAPRRTPPVTSSVSDLAAARRRRNARTWLVAAAAAVAIGIGINQLDLSVSSNEDSGSSASSADQPEAGVAGGDLAAEPSASAPEGSSGHAPADSAGAGAGQLDGLFTAGPTRLDRDRFGADVRRLRRTVDTTASQATAGREMHLAKSCLVPDGPGRLVAVRYDGQRGVLVYRPVKGDTQVVDLYLCGADEPTRSITLAHR